MLDIYEAMRALRASSRKSSFGYLYGPDSWMMWLEDNGDYLVRFGNDVTRGKGPVGRLLCEAAILEHMAPRYPDLLDRIIESYRRTNGGAAQGAEETPEVAADGA